MKPHKTNTSPSRPSSRVAGLHRLPIAERRARVGALLGLSAAELDRLAGAAGLEDHVADAMIENALGAFSLPFGVGLNFVVNGADYVIPMVVEEPSVVAAVSFAAKLVRGSGGFTAEADPSVMIAQVQVADYGDPARARDAVLGAKAQLLSIANGQHPRLLERGGGAIDLEVRVLPAPEGPGAEPILVVHLLVDSQEAMGANLLNTMAEAIAPAVAEVTSGRVHLRILSNLADRRCARARCRIPVADLADFGLAGADIAAGIVMASRFAEADPYRAATHNKGIMNGVDAIAIATGQDWRAIEAGAHAFACRTGTYRPLSRWTCDGAHLEGQIELPLALGTVGGPIKVHAGVQLAMRMLGHPGVQELAGVFAAVGLAQNFAAVRALGSVGIQRGHMALHARSVALSAGARGVQVERLARSLVARGDVKLETARALLPGIPAVRPSAPCS